MDSNSNSLIPRPYSSANKKALNKTKVSPGPQKQDLYVKWNNGIQERLGELMKRQDEYEEVRKKSNKAIKSIFEIKTPQLVPSQVIPSRKSSFRPLTAPPNLNKSTKPSSAETLERDRIIIDFLKKVKSTGNSASYHEETHGLSGPNSVHQSQQNEKHSTELVSCMKKIKNDTPKKLLVVVPVKPQTPNVTFSPDTINIHRESKPKKLKTPKNNRKPRFAHPCCGHFRPPDQEIINFKGPIGIELFDNPYTKFTHVWRHPTYRNLPETISKWKIRSKRFDNLLADMSKLNFTFRALAYNMKTKFLMTEILPRYILALDIALLDGDLVNCERLVNTIMSSVQFLQAVLHEMHFHKNGNPKDLPSIPPEQSDYLENLGPLIFSLNRISVDRPREDTDFLGIEPAFAKLQFELMSLLLCPTNSVLFRCLVSVIPHTVNRISTLLEEIDKNKDPKYYIKWANNSVMHRDYMSILKDLGLADENGARDKPPTPRIKFHESSSSKMRPKSAECSITLRPNRH